VLLAAQLSGDDLIISGHDHSSPSLSLAHHRREEQRDDLLTERRETSTYSEAGACAHSEAADRCSDPEESMRVAHRANRPKRCWRRGRRLFQNSTIGSAGPV